MANKDKIVNKGEPVLTGTEAIQVALSVQMGDRCMGEFSNRAVDMVDHLALIGYEVTKICDRRERIGLHIVSPDFERAWELMAELEAE